MNKPIIYWIDLFCGAGGTTTGIHMANAKVIACVNHDEYAIKSHEANHPDCLHLTEDIRDFEVIRKLKVLVDSIRQKEPYCIINIWASLECTNFSNAKGGLPRDADSRTLAQHLYIYLEELNPSYLYIENVREFMSWGPLGENGRPISRRNGSDYIKWVNTIKSYGYDHDYKLLDSADFGAYTSRQRYFGVFAKKGLYISWPEPTHCKSLPTEPGLFENTKEKWKAVKNVLNLNEEGKSIFGNTKAGKPYSDKTLKRVFTGLKKYSKSNPIFITSYYGNGSAHSTDEPCNTLTTKDRFALHFINYDYSTATSSSIDSPVGALTTIPKHNLVSTNWVFDTQYSNSGRLLDRPAPTLIARMDKKPLYLATVTNKGDIDQRIGRPEDSQLRKEMREYMRVYGIVDVKIRPLFIDELLKIQGFPDDYILKGSKTNQLKFIGNSVVPLISQKLVEANYKALKRYFKKTA